MKEFIAAYVALYGGTMEYAARVWRSTNTAYHKVIIESFKKDALCSFYND